jgi:hypothetical protein
MVNAIFRTPTPTPTPTPTQTRGEEQEKQKTEDKGGREEREGQEMLPTGIYRLGSLASAKLLSGQCSLRSTKLLSGQVQPTGPMGLQQLHTGQFTFSHQQTKKQFFKVTFEKAEREDKMIITILSLIAAGIATSVVTGGITGTSVYLTAGDADVVTRDQIKTE